MKSDVKQKQYSAAYLSVVSQTCNRGHMDSSTIIGYALKATVIFVLLYLIHRRDRNSLVELTDSVNIRGTTLSRVLNWDVKNVKKADIVRIQMSGASVTLFNTSDNAYDIFPRAESVIDIFNHAKTIFPDAEVVIID
jgi:hypothetical protein